MEQQGAHEGGGRALGGRSPVSWIGPGAPGLDSFAKNSFFIIYLLEDEQELSLGMLDTSPTYL